MNFTQPTNVEILDHMYNYKYLRVTLWLSKGHCNLAEKGIELCSYSPTDTRSCSYHL